MIESELIGKFVPVAEELNLGSAGRLAQRAGKPGGDAGVPAKILARADLGDTSSIVPAWRRFVRLAPEVRTWS